MVGLDLGGSDLRDVLEVEGHVGRFVLFYLLIRCGTV